LLILLSMHARPSIFGRLKRRMFSAAARQTDDTREAPASSFFLSEQATRIGAAERAAFISETAAASEALIVERLQLLLREQQSAQCQATLVGLFETVPAGKLMLILAENEKHHFFADPQLDGMIARLSLARLLELASAPGASAWAGFWRRVSVVERVRSAIDEASAEQLRARWQHQPELLVGLAAQVPPQAARLARRLLSAVADQASVRQLAARIIGQLGHGQAWELVCHYVQLQQGSERAGAFGFMLESLGAARAAAIIAERFNDAEIRVYWALFSDAVRRELAALGREVWSGSADAGGRRGPAGRAPKSDARSARPGAGRPSAAQPREVREALQVIKSFGFHEAMTYREARRRYWQLASEWHPDRVGSSPVVEEKIRSLNFAWNMAKVCFAN
jgi:hypothetical protein